MADPRPPKKRPSVFDRVRESAGRAFGSVVERVDSVMNGPVDERTGQRLRDMSEDQYREYLGRESAELPKPTDYQRDVARSYAPRPASAPVRTPDLGGLPAGQRVVEANAAASNPQTSDWLRSNLEDVAASVAGQQEGTAPLAKNVPQPVLDENTFDRMAEPAMAPQSPFDAFRQPRSFPTREEDLAEMQDRSRSRTAEEALEANETEEEFEARMAATPPEEPSRLDRIAPEGTMVRGALSDMAEAARGKMRPLATLGTEIGRALETREDRREETGEEEMPVLGNLEDFARRGFANIGHRAGRISGNTPHDLESGNDGFVDDMFGDVLLTAGTAPFLRAGSSMLGAGLRKLGPMAGRLTRPIREAIESIPTRGQLDDVAERAGRQADDLGGLTRGDEEIRRLSRGTGLEGDTRTAAQRWASSGENAVEEFALRAGLGDTDETYVENPFMAAATAGLATRPLGAVLRGAGEGLGLAARGAGALAEEVGATVSAAQKLVSGQGIDAPTRQQYRQTLASLDGMDEDIVSGLSDSELLTAMEAIAPTMLPSGGRSGLTGADRTRLKVAGTGALMAATLQSEEDARGERESLGSGSIADLLAGVGVAGAVAKAGRGARLLSVEAENIGWLEGYQKFLFETPDGPIEALIKPEGELLKVEWVGRPRGYKPVNRADYARDPEPGPAVVRDMIRQVVERFPDAKRWEAERISGARMPIGADKDPPIIRGEIPRPDANRLLALAGTMAASGRADQAKRVVTSIVGRTAEEAIKMMRRVGMNRNAESFSRFIEGSKFRTPLFHGTLADFDVHAADQATGAYYGSRGKAYFTSQVEDANQNYASVTGPDQANKIAQDAERMLDDWQYGGAPEDYDPAQFGGREWDDLSWDEQYYYAEQVATQSLGNRGMGPQPNVQPVWARGLRPAVIEPGGGGTVVRLVEDEEMGTIQLFARHPDGDEFELSDLEDAFRMAARGFDGVDPEDLSGMVITNLIENGGEIDLFDIDRAIRVGTRGYVYDSDNGEMAVGEFVADVFKELGFDSIDMNASATFIRMGLPPGTRHIITFDPGQVKSVTGNNGNFDWTNPNITLGVTGLAMLAASGGWNEDQADASMLPVGALAGMTSMVVRGKRVRMLKPRGMSNEYKAISDRLGYDPAHTASGYINEGSITSYREFVEKMRESYGDKFHAFENDLPIVMAEAINLAAEQRYLKMPPARPKGRVTTLMAAQNLNHAGRTTDRLTDIWGDNGTPDQRMARAARHGFREAQKALVLQGDAAAWYRQDIEMMTEALTEYYRRPGLLSEKAISRFGPNPMDMPSHRTLYKAILAVTSNGNEVTYNLLEADQIYRNFLETGQLTLFKSRQLLEVSPFTIGAARLLDISVADAQKLKQEDWPQPGTQKKNMLDQRLSEFAAGKNKTGEKYNADQLQRAIKKATNEAVEEGEIGQGVKGRKIWHGELVGRGHSRQDIHERQLMRLQEALARLGGDEVTDEMREAGQLPEILSQKSVDELDGWLTTRYLGGDQKVVAEALAALGDPPPITAAKEVQDTYLRELSEYRRTNGLNDDELLITYHSIRGPEARKQVSTARNRLADMGLPVREAGTDPVQGIRGLDDKIGRFFLNLYGIQDEATVDLWMTRWYRRVMGHVETKNNGKSLDDAPRPWEKGEIREAISMIAEQLSRSTGRKWQTSDVQALLWYWEKELYNIAGAPDSGKVSYSMATTALTKGMVDPDGKLGNRFSAFVKELQTDKEQRRHAGLGLPASNPDKIPALSYEDLKTPNGGMSFAAMPGLALLSEEEGEPDRGVALGVLGAGALAAAAVRGKLKVRIPTSNQTVQYGPATEKLLQKFVERPVPERGERFLSQLEHIYAKAVDMAYPLKKLGERMGAPELIQQARASTGWQRAADDRIAEDLGEAIRMAQGVEEPTIALATAQREIELRKNGFSERTELSDDDLAEIVMEHSANPQVDAAAQALRQFYRNLLDRKLEEGVIDRETYDRIVAKGEYYVPMVRDFRFGKAVMTGTGQQLWANSSKGLRRLSKNISDKRKELSIIDPYEQAIHDAAMTERAVAKQRITNIVSRIVQDNPEATYPFIREVVNPLKDLSDPAVAEAHRVYAASEAMLTRTRDKISSLEAQVEKIRSTRDMSKKRWQDQVKNVEGKLRTLRTLEAKRADLTEGNRKAWVERESQARAKKVADGITEPTLEDLKVVKAIVDGRVKHYEVTDEDLFNAWAAAPKEVQSTWSKFLSPAKRILQTSVTMLPDFMIANAMRDNFMTSTQYPLTGKRIAIGATLGGAVGGAVLTGENDRREQFIGAAAGASFAALPVGTKALVKHMARTFSAMRDVLAAQPGNRAGRAGGAFGAGAGLGVGMAVAGEDDQLGGAIAGTAAGAGSGAAMARLLAKYGNAATYHQWVRNGGAGFGFFPRTRKDTQKLLNELRLNGVDPRTIVHPHSLWDGLQLIGRVIEEAPRLARYKEGLARGETELAATAASRDISLDFAKHGSSRTVQGFNESTAFYNAKLQGTDKLLRLLKDPKTWGVGMATITAPTVALWMLNRKMDQEGRQMTYASRPVWEKNLFWHIPKMDGTGFYRIPKPFEVGFIFASVPERILDWVGEEDPEMLDFAFGDMFKSSTEGFIPIPTAIRGAGEAFLLGEHGTDIFRQQPVVPRNLQDLPTQQQFDGRTSNLARGIGAATEAVADVIPGQMWEGGVSPKKIDHVINSQFGSVGRMVNQGIDAAARGIGVDQRPVPVAGAAPIVGRFTAPQEAITAPESALRRRYAKAYSSYRGLSKVAKEGVTPQEVLNAYNSGDPAVFASVLRDGNIKEAAQVVKDNAEQINEYHRLKGVKRWIDEASRYRRQVEMDNTLSRSQRRERVAAVNREIMNASRQYLSQ